MEKKLRNSVLVGIVLILLFGGAVLAARSIKAEKIYTAAPGTISDPTSGEWTEAENGEVTLEPGESISIGIENEAIEHNKKVVKIFFTGSYAGRYIRVTGAVGVDGQNNSVKGSPHRGYPAGTDNATTDLYTFDPQPAYEVFQVQNKDFQNNRTFKVQAWSTCYQVRPAPQSRYEGDEGTLKINSIYIGYPGTEATIEMDKVGFWHEQKTTEDGNFVPPEVNDPYIPSDPSDPNSPTGTWLREYITVDPNTGEALPQGGWLWSCQPSDRGIWEAEEFGLSMTTTTLAGGRYWMVVHDRLREEWFRFPFEEEDVQYWRGDLDRDRQININDFVLLAERWLQYSPI